MWETANFIFPKQSKPLQLPPPAREPKPSNALTEELLPPLASHKVQRRLSAAVFGSWTGSTMQQELGNLHILRQDGKVKRGVA
mmetsp:Transcript_94938/g.283506  ORF Transcript_94938/g.283506 Transcript_94938/m.283506 type:complete len:83 (-) Transcript_94938:943-1191(-)